MIKVILAGNSLHETVTVNPVRMLGVQQLGTIEINKDADLLILNNNPLDNIEYAVDIFAVLTKRRYIDREWIENIREKKY